MDNNRINVVLAIAIVVVVIAASISTPIFSQTEEKKTLRIGYFPNINHAQAVIGLGRGDFQKALGDNVEVTTQIFSDGP